MSLFCQALKDNHYLDELEFIICNVGSRKIEPLDDYASQGWSILAPNLKIYGFDADADACEAANADLAQREINWEEQHLAYALGKAEESRTLYVTNEPMCSSLYPPNEPYLARFEDLLELAGLNFSVEIETTTLDLLCKQENIPEIDFLQIDVQGADLDVLNGAVQSLSSVLGIQIEVEFSPIYTNQPLFADIDQFLRSYDFTLFDLLRAYRRHAKSLVRSNLHPGRLLWGEAFYFRDLLNNQLYPHVDPLKLLKLACIADQLEFYDYAMELLIQITTHYGHEERFNFANVIFDVVSTIKGADSSTIANTPLMASLAKFRT